VRFLADVEAALVETLSDIGLCPPKVAQDVRRACAEVTPAEVYEEERRIAHSTSGASARRGASTLPARAAVGADFIR
jgi:adenylosuccinate lyase